MVQLEMSGSEQKIQALRDCLQGEDDEFQRRETDRRRPGRAAEANPNLVPLLRGEAEAALLAGDDLDLSYGLEHTTPMLGVAVGMIMSIPLWSLLGLIAWAILR